MIDNGDRQMPFAAHGHVLAAGAGPGTLKFLHKEPPSFLIDWPATRPASLPACFPAGIPPGPFLPHPAAPASPGRSTRPPSRRWRSDPPGARVSVAAPLAGLSA